MARIKATPVNKGPARSSLGAKKSASPAPSPVRPAVPEKAATPAPKRPHRFRPGTVAIREIKYYQKSTNLLIPRAAFARLVREIAQGVSASETLRWRASAIVDLQEATESYMVGIFGDAQLNSIYRGAKTVDGRDMKHTAFMRKKTENVNLEHANLPVGSSRVDRKNLQAAVIPDNTADDDDDDDDDDDEHVEEAMEESDDDESEEEGEEEAEEGEEEGEEGEEEEVVVKKVQTDEKKPAKKS